MYDLNMINDSAIIDNDDTSLARDIESTNKILNIYNEDHPSIFARIINLQNKLCIKECKLPVKDDLYNYKLGFGAVD